MKKLLILVALLICFSICARADRWRVIRVPVVTNLTTVALGEEFTPPRVLDGFYLYPNTSICTNTVILSQTNSDGTTGAYSSNTFTNEPLYVKSLDLLVKDGDTLHFTNTTLRGTMYLNFKME